MRKSDKFKLFSYLYYFIHFVGSILGIAYFTNHLSNPANVLAGFIVSILYFTINIVAFIEFYKKHIK